MSLMSAVIIILVVLVVLGVAYWILPSGSKPDSAEKSMGDIKWRDDDEILITYKVKPPHFRNIPSGDPMEEFTSCGFCKYFSHENGCAKYGVNGRGVGSVVKTVCDDFVTVFGED